MRHDFETRLVPAGEPEVIEHCPCGAKRVRYAGGRLVYINARGGKTPYNTIPCTRELSAAQTRVNLTNPAPVIRIPIPAFTDTEARLRESIVTIKLMYEDMVKHGVDTKSRRIAGTFLHSQGYEQLVKELDKRTT